MHVRPGRTTSAPGVPNLIASLYSLSRFYRNSRKVTIARSYSVAVVNDYEVAVTCMRRSIYYKPIGCGSDRCAEVDGNIQALVYFAPLAVKGVSPHSETVSDVSIHRKAAWDRSQAKNVRPQMFVNVANFALELIGCFIEGHYRFRATNTHQFIDFRRVLHLCFPRKLLGHIFNVGDLTLESCVGILICV